MKPDTQRGVYEKFTVERNDGSSSVGGKHEFCRYFVLDLDHDRFSAPALLAYAEACAVEFPDLASDLRTLAASNARIA